MYLNFCSLVNYSSFCCIAIVVYNPIYDQKGKYLRHTVYFNLFTLNYLTNGENDQRGAAV